MALSVTHTFVSAIADDPTASAAGEVLPSHWNASHTLTGQVDLTSQVTGILPAANGGTGTSTGYLPRTVNAQTGTTYTVVASDIGKLVTTSNAAAIATTLPQATGSFGAGSIIWIENKGAGTNTITPTTSTIDGSATLALTTNQGVTLVSDGTNWTTIRGIGGAGGGTPGGSNGQLQYNNAGAFGGVPGSAVSTLGALTLNNGGLSVSEPILNLAQTWANAAVTFTGVKLNVTNTNSASGSLLMDLELGSTSMFIVRKDGAVALAGNYIIPTSSTELQVWVSNGNTNVANFNTSGIIVATNTGYIGWSDVALRREAANVINMSVTTSAQAFRVYNTTDNNTSPTNYERFEIDWISTANVCFVRNKSGGTGTARLMVPVTGSTTVASLPAASTAGAGARAFVTDANATTFHSTVAGGGANKVSVVSDGTNWLIGG